MENISEIVQDSRSLIIECKNKNIAIDATCGNGHDTLFLTSIFNDIYAFDIQKLAIKRTSKRLEGINNVKLINDDFNNINKYVEKADLIIFNLGFLPGSDRKVKTQDYSSDEAIIKAYNLLNENGLLIIASYRAHEGGMDEYNRIIEKIKSLNFEIRDCYSNNECLIVIRK